MEGGRDENLDIPEKKPQLPGSDKVRLELERLSKQGKIRPRDYEELQKKYPNEEIIVREVLRQSIKKYNKIRKLARELARKILTKYYDGSKTLHEILEKMLRYKKDNKWSDAEYDEFRKELSHQITGRRELELGLGQAGAINKSRINQALGAPVNWALLQSSQGLRIKDSEQGVLAEILSIYERTLALHSSVFMQSLTYEDCSLQAMTGLYRRERHIATNYIHPVVACMFLPKFEIFEVHMLYANFGNIIKTRHERGQIVTEPDALLFYEITTDPNDVVCDISSAITDLRNRYRVQIALWDTVRMLRNGNYYEDKPISEFLTLLNSCRNNLYDNADLAYNQDEGAIMRRLLSVFSLRPTIIATQPISSIASFMGGPLAMYGALPYSSNVPYGIFPFNNQPVYTITNIPMVTLQIPPYTPPGADEKNLQDALAQTIWFNENKVIIPKEQQIIYSKEVLIFYVNRRVQRVQVRSFTNPLLFSQLPLTMSAFERLNSYPVNVPASLSLAKSGDIYNLRSIVAVTETEFKRGDRQTNIITGSTGLIMTHRSQALFEPMYRLYDPLGASIPVRHPDPPDGKEGYFTNKPISGIPAFFSQTINGVYNPSFFDRASRYGTVFIYSKPGGYLYNEVISF